MSGNDSAAFGQHSLFEDQMATFAADPSYGHGTQQYHDGDTQPVDIDLDNHLAHHSITNHRHDPRTTATAPGTDFSHYSDFEENFPAGAAPHYIPSSSSFEYWDIDNLVDQSHFTENPPSWNPLQATQIPNHLVRAGPSHHLGQAPPSSVEAKKSLDSGYETLPHSDGTEVPQESTLAPSLSQDTEDHDSSREIEATASHNRVDTLWSMQSQGRITDASPNDVDVLWSMRPQASTTDPRSSPNVICLQCGFTATNPSNLKKHIKGHEKPCLCSQLNCEKAQPGNGFANTNDLDRHLWSIHSIGNKDLFLCCVEGCDKIDKRGDNFRDHLKRKHPSVDDLDFYCERSRLTSEDQRYVGALRRCRDQSAQQKTKSQGTPSKVTKRSTKKGASSKRTRPSTVGDNNAKEELEQDLKLSPVQDDLPGPSQQGATLQAGEQFAGLPNLPDLSAYYSAQQPQQPQWMALSSNSFMHENLPIHQSRPPQPADQARYYQHPGIQFSAQPAEHSRPDTRYQLNHNQRQYQQEPQHHAHQQPTHAVSPDASDIHARHVTVPFISLPLDGNLVNKPAQNFLSSEDVVEEVSATLDTHYRSKSTHRMPFFPDVPHVTHITTQAVTAPLHSFEMETATDISFEDEARTHVGFVADRPTVSIGSNVCPTCKYSSKMASGLKKHMARHDRPWICMWDDCCNNKVSGLGNVYNGSDLGWSSSGSKYDQARHEQTLHVAKDQAVDCFRCTGHDDNGNPCYRLFLATNVVEYIQHLLQCGLSHSAVEAERNAAFIPANFCGKFWCGYCNLIISNRPIEELANADARRSGRGVPDSLTGDKMRELYLDERRLHIIEHTKNGGMRGNEGTWRYLNGNGGSKFDLDHARRATDENARGDKGKGRARPRRNS